MSDIKCWFKWVNGSRVFAGLCRVLDSKPAAVWTVQDLETNQVFKISPSNLG